jgi:hypothetical protein
MDRLLVCGLHGSPLSDNPAGVTMSHALGYTDFPELFGKTVAASRLPSMRDCKKLRHSVLDTESTVYLGLMASKTVDPESSSG